MLLDNFFLTLEQDIKNLEEAIALKDYKQIAHFAHYIKSSCLNLVMKEAALILSTIEKEANEGKMTLKEDDINQLKYIFKSIKTTL